MTKLILFDIDGTLVLTGGAGGRAMAMAFRDVFGLDHGLQSVSMAGRTDASIIAQMASLHGLTCDADAVSRFQAAYIGYLRDEIHKPGPQKGVLPGVKETLDALAQHEGIHLALLTGNFEQGAQIKLEYFGLWKYFRSGAFGDATHDRNSLLGTAIHRLVAAGGPPVHPADAIVVGDTPLDVAVALAGGARSLAVATGGYDVDALRTSGADVVLKDLSDLDAVLRGLGLTTGPGVKSGPGRVD